jgi:hypothetical protein
MGATLAEDEEFKRDLTRRTIDLWGRTQFGHMDDIAYQNGGGAILEECLRNIPDYYQYSGEIRHIGVNKSAIASHLKDTEHLFVVGQGPLSAFKQKDLQIIDQLPKVKSVTFVDLSRKFNKAAASFMKSHTRGRGIDVEALHMDFRNAADIFKALKIDAPRPHTSVMSTGGLVSNIHNASTTGFPQKQMEGMLRAYRDLASDDGYVMLGYDSNHNYDRLRRAYEKFDPFIINLTKIIADNCLGIEGFQPGDKYFKYEMEWNLKASQIAHKLVATHPQAFRINNGTERHNYLVNQDEEFIVISSIKPDALKMGDLGRNVGMETANIFLDGNGLAEHVFKRAAAPVHQECLAENCAVQPETPAPVIP